MVCLQSQNVCWLDRGACHPQGGWDPNSPAGATQKEAGRAGGRGEMPYSMMCRASTSETSSLSGSGIFFFSSTGRLGGCAGCGCSSSSSYQNTSLCDLGRPHRDRHRAPKGRTHFWNQVRFSCPLTIPGMCHASSLTQFMIF